MIRIFCFIVLVFRLSLLPAWADHDHDNENTSKELTPITLQLMWQHQFEFAGFYAAKAQGFYQDVGLDVSFKEFDFGSNIVDEVISGRAQYGINDSSLIINRGNDSPVVLLSNIFQHSPMVLISRSDSGITSPAQMIGKKLMIAEHELSNASITAMLSKESVSLDQVEVIDHTFNADDLIHKKVDVMSAYATNEPAVFKQHGIAINIINPINYGIDFYGNNIFTSEAEIKANPKRAQDFVAASLKGWQYALENPAEIIDLILDQYSQKKSRDALEFEAKTIQQYILPKFIPLGTVDLLRMQRTVNTYQELNLLSKSFQLKGFLASDYIKNKPIQNIYTAEELDWIKHKKTLSLGVDPNWRPFEFINSEGQYSGMSADFLNLISQKSGLDIQVLHHDTWADVISSAKNNKLDVLPAVMRSTQRDEFLDFTTPYITYPMVIVTSKNSSFISELNDLKGEKVVVVRGYATEDIIRQNHPTLQLLTATDIDEALSIVSSGDATAFVDNLATITTAISKGGFNNLRISGTTKYRFEISLAVPKGEELLLSILQKSINSISDLERSDIQKKWISLQYTKIVDYLLVYQIIAVAIIIILLIFFWNRRLSKEIKSRIIAEQKVLESESQFRRLFEDNNAIELIIDPETRRIVEANKAAIAFYGYPIDVLIGKKIMDINILSEEEKQKEIELAAKENRNYFNYRHKLATGEVKDIEAHSSMIQWNDKNLVYSIIHDVSKQKQLQAELAQKAQELEYHATHDALTGLINRREFGIRLSQAIAHCNTHFDSQKTLMALDLDNFKIVNDSAGHAIGDEVLLKISSLMKTQVSDHDTFARLGGDEFGVLLEDCSIKDAEKIAQSIIKAVSEFQYRWNSSTFHLGVSIGIAKIDCYSPSMDEIISQADAACYEAKNKGRNRYEIFSDDITSLSKRTGERWWTNEILSAIDENRFCLYRQKIEPITPNAEGQHFEVLLRLNNIYGTLVQPDNFIPSAELYNLMPTIDKWVIENVFSWLSSHPEELIEINKCSINLSGQSIADHGFYEYVMAKFDQHQIPSHKICWEITETAAIADFDKAKLFISQMRSYGCSFSLDDFGTGLSSFNYLKHLEVDYIKIDGSFIVDLINSPKDHLIVESIHTISQGLNMKTIAEYVENDETKRRLGDIGIHYVQGYGLHKPTPLN